jgi:dTDP-4-dehydrorhamnose 3,5-epimerase
MIQGLKIFESSKHTDSRGEFIRFFDGKIVELENKKIQQINISRNPHIHTLRGLHFQVGKESEHKVLYLNHGAIFLAIIDLRKNSTSYLEKYEVTLDSKEHKSIYIPAGCATGWMSLKRDTEIIYLMCDRYEDCAYSGLRYDDPSLDISWPAKPKVISEKDLNWEFLEIKKC